MSAQEELTAPLCTENPRTFSCFRGPGNLQRGLSQPPGPAPQCDPPNQALWDLLHNVYPLAGLVNPGPDMGLKTLGVTELRVEAWRSRATGFMWLVERQLLAFTFSMFPRTGEVKCNLSEGDESFRTLIPHYLLRVHRVQLDSAPAPMLANTDTEGLNSGALRGRGRGGSTRKAHPPPTRKPGRNEPGKGTSLRTRGVPSPSRAPLFQGVATLELKQRRLKAGLRAVAASREGPGVGSGRGFPPDSG